MAWWCDVCVVSACVCVCGGGGRVRNGERRKEEGEGTKGWEVMTAVTAVTVTRFTEKGE